MSTRRKLGIFAALAVACSALFGVMADELKPLSYEAVTNYIKYERITEYIRAPKDTNYFVGWKTQTTNWPAAITHSVTWGRGTNKVFILKTCEVLKMPEQTNGWRNAEMRWFNAATWIESVK